MEFISTLFFKFKNKQEFKIPKINMNLKTLYKSLLDLKVISCWFDQ